MVEVLYNIVLSLVPPPLAQGEKVDVARLSTHMVSLLHIQRLYVATTYIKYYA